MEPLKKYPLEITSVTSMTDDGGSTGQLRAAFGVLPPGDIRRHIAVLSDAPDWKKKMWSFRFGEEEFEGGHKGHSFGNVFIAGLEKNLKDYGEVLRECCKFMEVDKRYRPYPATLGKVTLCAELEDGQVIEGESEIDVPKKHSSDLRIKRIFLKPAVKAYKNTLLEIERADALIFGPGDLYSSTLPCFLPLGIKTAISKSKAKKILVCNVMDKRGETNGFTAEDFASEVEKYIGTNLDSVLCNASRPDKDVLRAAKRADGSLLEPVGFGGATDKDKFIEMDLLKKGAIEHDAKKTGEAIWKLIR